MMMATTPAKVAPKPADPRDPDTVADKTAGTPASLPELDPAGYGFGSIDTSGAEAAHAEGPGYVEPVRVESVTAPTNSTFAERAAARSKVVTGGVAGPAVTEK